MMKDTNRKRIAMRFTESTEINTIFRACIAERVSVSELARIACIERTRMHRIVHCDASRLREMLTIGEALRIANAFPNQNFDF